MIQSIAAAREWHGVDAAVFRDQIVAANQPAVLQRTDKTLAGGTGGLRLARALCDYIKGFDSGGNVDLLIGEPSIQRTILLPRRPDEP